MKVRLLVVLALLGVAFLPIRALAQGGDGGVRADNAPVGTLATIRATPFQTFSGRVDHAANGVGLRNFDSGTIRLRGIPTNSTVVRAFLYWSMICDEAGCPDVFAIEFEGRTIFTSLVCRGGVPCWAGSALGLYRADVTGLLPGSTTAAVPNKVINGDYVINGIPAHPRDRQGQDPWNPVTANIPKGEGASLVVIYSNPSLPTSGKVYIHNGCQRNVDNTTDVINDLSAPVPSPLLFAKFTRINADGQVGFGTSANSATSDERTFFTGPVGATCPEVVPQIAGDGSPKDVDSDLNGADGSPLNQLWDTRTTNVGDLLAAGATNYCVRYVTSADCVNFNVYVLSVR